MLFLSQWEISLPISRPRDLGHLRRSLWETSVSHYKKKNLLSHCRKIAGNLDWCNHMICNKIAFACKLFLHWKLEQKMIKGRCAMEMQQLVDAETVANIIVLAHLHDCGQLKSVCLHWIRKNLQHFSVKEENWELLKSHPDLLVDIMVFVAA